MPSCWIRHSARLVDGEGESRRTVMRKCFQNLQHLQHLTSVNCKASSASRCAWPSAARRLVQLVERCQRMPHAVGAVGSCHGIMPFGPLHPTATLQSSAILASNQSDRVTVEPTNKRGRLHKVKSGPSTMNEHAAPISHAASYRLVAFSAPKSFSWNGIFKFGKSRYGAWFKSLFVEYLKRRVHRGEGLFRNRYWLGQQPATDARAHVTAPWTPSISLILATQESAATAASSKQQAASSRAHATCSSLKPFYLSSTSYPSLLSPLLFPASFFRLMNWWGVTRASWYLGGSVRTEAWLPLELSERTAP